MPERHLQGKAYSRYRGTRGATVSEPIMSDTLQALLDSGALYLVFGAVICIVLGIAAARRLFKGANKIKDPE
jgi:hypothetical protein